MSRRLAATTLGCVMMIMVLATLSTAAVVNVTNAQMKEFLANRKPVVIDVREASAHRAGAIPGSFGLYSKWAMKFNTYALVGRIPLIVGSARAIGDAFAVARNWDFPPMMNDIYVASEGMESYAGPLTKLESPYYINMTGAAVHATQSKPYVIDVREPDEFAAGHIPTAFNIPRGHLAKRIGEIDVTHLPGGVHVICRSGVRSTLATLTLVQELGLSNIVNINDGMLAWPGPVETSPVPLYANVTTADLQQLFQTAFVLDVRTPEEYASRHIPGAVNIPVADVVNRRRELPHDKDIYVICGSGIRSLRATLALLDVDKGFKLKNVLGGMSDWQGPVV